MCACVLSNVCCWLSCIHNVHNGIVSLHVQQFHVPLLLLLCETHVRKIYIRKWPPLVNVLSQCDLLERCFARISLRRIHIRMVAGHLRFCARHVDDVLDCRLCESVYRIPFPCIHIYVLYG